MSAAVFATLLLFMASRGIILSNDQSLTNLQWVSFAHYLLSTVMSPIRLATNEVLDATLKNILEQTTKPDLYKIKGDLFPKDISGSGFFLYLYLFSGPLAINKIVFLDVTQLIQRSEMRNGY